MRALLIIAISTLIGCASPIDEAVGAVSSEYSNTQSWICEGYYSESHTKVSGNCALSVSELRCDDLDGDGVITCTLLPFERTMRLEYLQTAQDCDKGCNYCTTKLYVHDLDSGCIATYTELLISEQL